MITIPRTANPKFSQQGDKPSEELMLMALAHMKDIGRIPTKEQPEAVGSPATDSDFADVERQNAEVGIRVRPDQAGDYSREYNRRQKGK